MLGKVWLLNVWASWCVSCRQEHPVLVELAKRQTVPPVSYTHLDVYKRQINWFRYASPQTFYPLAGKLIPWFWALAAIFGVAGLSIGFLPAPTDAQQGEGYRIIFLHVPASWMSMFIYLVMAFWAGTGLAFNTRLSGMMASALAPTGALFAFLSLWTGALWGKPMWGAWCCLLYTSRCV